MKKNKNKNSKLVVDHIMVDGMTTYGKMDNVLHVADFLCTEVVEMEPWTAVCKVQCMRDGNLYVTELPKRVRNKPIYREDNATFSQGQDKRWYFYFSLDEEELPRLPEELVRQAKAIARKVESGLVGKGNGK
ncbi:MAG: hypothetical protein IJR02_08950 [Bacteroidaceae bacterium]|nr:hypothetical protein [Bacteroidaceae bacterium]